jgi:hypothetical protein
MFGQDLKKLEDELENISLNDTKLVKQTISTILQIDPFNESAILYFILASRGDNFNDSVTMFFEELKQNNPGRPEPYLLSAKYQFKQFSLEDTTRIGELRMAIKIDSQCLEANYQLAVSYYTLFSYAIWGRSLKKAEYYALKSKEYFIKTANIEPEKANSLKYPIIQLSHFLGKLQGTDYYFNYNLAIKTDSINRPQNTYYFPLKSFLELPEDWTTNYKFNVVKEIEAANYTLKWYSDQLYSLQESLIYNQKDGSIYRFTLLPSWESPVAIRIEKRNNEYMLYVRMTNGMGGCSVGDLTVCESKEITQENWDSFLLLLAKANFWELSTNEEFSFGTDGSQWIIEGIEGNKYHVVDRWCPNGDYEKCGLFLLELAGI